jgi:phage head maturation protease
MSHGFRSNKEKEIREVRENPAARRVDIYRTVMEVSKHFDVSVVSQPANDATEISARSISEGVIAEVKQERLAIEARRKVKEQISIMAEMI